MAKYPIKMLKDEDNVPFVPLVGTDAIVDPSGTTLQEKLNAKLEKDNIIAGDNVTITEKDGNLTISTSGKGTLIDNLDTDESGLGGLDAHQGKVLKEMIPAIANNLTTIDATQTLSAYQGYILNNRVVPKGGDEGQVLKKSADGDWQLEWGDAADPNAIIGDGTIKKIIYLTWDEYKALETVDEYTEYHITDMSEDMTYLSRDDIQDMIVNNITSNLEGREEDKTPSVKAVRLYNYSILDEGTNIDNVHEGWNRKTHTIMNATGTLPTNMSATDNNIIIETIFWGDDWGRQFLHDIRSNKSYVRDRRAGVWDVWGVIPAVYTKEIRLTTDSAGNKSIGLNTNQYRLIDIVQVGSELNCVVTHYAWGNEYYVHTGTWNGDVVSGTCTFKITYMEV